MRQGRVASSHGASRFAAAICLASLSERATRARNVPAAVSPRACRASRPSAASASRHRVRLAAFALDHPAAVAAECAPIDPSSVGGAGISPVVEVVLDLAENPRRAHRRAAEHHAAHAASSSVARTSRAVRGRHCRSPGRAPRRRPARSRPNPLRRRSPASLVRPCTAIAAMPASSSKRAVVAH